MRAAYLEALAARALGTAPVLRPPTPSRFEPESPQAELTEATYVVDAAHPAEHRPNTREQPALLVEPRQAPRGRYEPDLVREHLAQPPAHATWLVPDTQPDLEALMPYAPAARTDPPEPRVAASSAMPSGEISAHLDDAAGLSQVKQGADDDPHRRDAHDRDPAGSEPAIVVHIGRVEVRAVQAPRPPAPAPRPHPPAQPSLADYLRARDRGRK